MKSICSKCHNKNAATPGGYCRQCKAAYMKAWRRKNRRTLVKNHMRKWKYGITSVEAEKMLHNQGAKCASCKRNLDITSMRIDHCHSTNYVRGILCNSCNIALGLMNDDPTAIRGLARYAAKHRK